MQWKPFIGIQKTLSGSRSLDKQQSLHPVIYYTVTKTGTTGDTTSESLCGELKSVLEFGI